PAIDRRLGIGEMVPDLAGAQHAIRPDLDSVGRDDGAAVEPGVAPDVDDRLGAGGDEAVDLGVGPGVDISTEFHSTGTRNPQPAIPQEARSEVDVAAPPIPNGGHPSQGARGGVLPLHWVVRLPGEGWR